MRFTRGDRVKVPLQRMSRSFSRREGGEWREGVANVAGGDGRGGKAGRSRSLSDCERKSGPCRSLTHRQRVVEVAEVLLSREFC